MRLEVCVSTTFKEKQMDETIEKIKEVLRAVAGDEDGLCVGFTYCNMGWDVFSEEAANNLATRFREVCEKNRFNFDVEII